jgi:hypothetical protein
VVPVAAKPREVDVFAVVIELPVERVVEPGAERVVEGRRIAPDHVKREHLLGLLSGDGLAGDACVQARAEQPQSE